MRIGGSFVLIALGAILRFAITPQHSHGVSWGTIGVILMIVGVLGAVLTIALMTTRRRTDIVYRGAPATYVDPAADPRLPVARSVAIPNQAPYSSATYVEPGPLDPRL